MTKIDEAQAAMVTVAGALAVVVENALAPVLRGERVQACEHVGVGMTTARHAYLCPQHPDRLLCDHDGCLARHYTERHREDELRDLRCFVCEQPVSDQVDGPIPIFGEVKLHRGVPLVYDDPATDYFLRNLSYSYRGVILTTAAAWLCHEHIEFVELPIRMSWPTTVAPSSVPERPPWRWAG